MTIYSIVSKLLLFLKILDAIKNKDAKFIEKEKENAASVSKYKNILG